jgi:hypothetical protein
MRLHIPDRRPPCPSDGRSRYRRRRSHRESNRTGAGGGSNGLLHDVIPTEYNQAGIRILIARRRTTDGRTNVRRQFQPSSRKSPYSNSANGVRGVGAARRVLIDSRKESSPLASSPLNKLDTNQPVWRRPSSEAIEANALDRSNSPRIIFARYLVSALVQTALRPSLPLAKPKPRQPYRHY